MFDILNSNYIIYTYRDSDLSRRRASRLSGTSSGDRDMAGRFTDIETLINKNAQNSTGFNTYDHVDQLIKINIFLYFQPGIIHDYTILDIHYP